MTTETATEAEKMARVAGIIFADGPTGRRARIAGTGLEVFEIAIAYHNMDCDLEHLREAFHWLSEAQLQAALRYAELYPEEIDPIVQEYLAFRIEDLWEKYPYMNPNR